MANYTLEEVDGNAFSILGYVSKIMEREGYSQDDVGNYLEDARSSDYEHLVSVSIDMIHNINLRKRGI